MMRIVNISFFGTLVVFFFSPGILFAAIDNFTVGVTVGADTTPPTTPTPVSSAAITSSQIDITWGASTDDQSLGGYRLFRDGVHIATTSLTTYSDTGLSAGATYSYTVQAFDWAFNYSSTSSSTATTTFSVVTTSSEQLPTAGGVTQVRLRSEVTVDTSLTTAVFQWSTNLYTRYAIRWGEAEVYDAGFVQTNVYKRSHTTTIPELQPGTTYVYELIVYDQRGREYVLSKDSFTTKNTFSNQAPSNAYSLHAIARGDSVALSWLNPEGVDLSKIRIVRNYFFYPSDPSDGSVVYEGKGTSYLDVGAFLEHDEQFYTLFVYDKEGRISSGALVFVAKQFTDTSIYNDDSDSYSLPIGDGGDKALSQSMSFEEVLVFQNASEVPYVDAVRHVVIGMPVMLYIPVAYVSSHPKAIIVTVEQGAEKASYLMRLNDAASMYQVTLPPFSYEDAYRLSFGVYDYRTNQLTRFTGVLYADAVAVDTHPIPVTTQQHVRFYVTYISVLTVFIGLILLLFIRLFRGSV